MLIVDSQIHLFGPGQERRAAAIEQRIMSADEVLATMDAAGVDRAYLVPAGYPANGACLDAARAWPDRFRVVGIVPLAEPDIGKQMIQDWSTGGMLGIRLRFPPLREPNWLCDGTADWFWPMAEQADIPVYIWAPGQLGKVGEIARSYPRLRLIIDHLGLYVFDRDDTVTAVVAELLPLAALPNVAVKASGLPDNSTDPYPFANLYAPIRSVVQAFGPHRVFWGSDLTRMKCPYDQVVTLFTQELGLADDEITQIMGTAIIAWMGW
jgi:L-fuconolactonase